MRRRPCITTASSPASMPSSRATARGRCRGSRGLCDRPRSGDRGAVVSGDAHLRTVSEENYGRRLGFRGDAGAPLVRGPTPDPGSRLPPPPLNFQHPRQAPGPHPRTPPFYWRPLPYCSRRPLPSYSWPPPPPRYGPQQSPPFGPPWNSWQPPPSDFRPPPPRPRPPPADYRRWVSSTLPPPPPECERFRVLSYNILADYLARDHQSKLYFHIPSELLDWEWRKRRLLIEIGLWSPDIMCLQEVDRFQNLEEELTRSGYNGVWKMRTGNAVDGCAIFWRTNRFVLRHEEHIEFAKLGLRDNVAQICVLESRSQNPADNGSAASSARYNPSLRSDQVVVCNIHVLYNPKRGEIKLGQVRVLLDQAYSVSKIWNDAPVIICGDFNCTPKSPLYNFISEQKLTLSGLARNEVSGQYSACIYAPWLSTGSCLHRAPPPHDDNDGRASPSELDNHQRGIKDEDITQKNVENALPVGSFSPACDSENLFSSCQLANAEGTKYDATAGEQVDEFDSLPMCEEKTSLKETVKDIIDHSAVMSYMGSKSENLTSGNAPSQGELLDIVMESQHDDKHTKDSFFTEMLNKQYEQVDSSHLVSPGNKEALHCALDTVNGVENTSTILPNCTLPTIQKDFIDVDMTKNTFNACHINMPSEDSKDCFSPSSDLENSLDSKSEPDLDVSSHQIISKTLTPGVRTSLPDNVEPLHGLVCSGEKADLDVSCQNSYENKPLDTNLYLEAVESSVSDLNRKMKNADFGSEQLEKDAYEKLKGNTEDIASRHIIYNRSSIDYSRNAAFSGGVDISALGDSSISASEITLESHSSHIGEDDGNCDSTFLEELHGMGNVDATSSSIQSIPLSFPDPFSGQNVGEGEVKSERLDSSVHESSKFQEKIYNPFLWTPMEIAAASGNEKYTYLEHNLKLKSAYTEAEDYVGTKDSSGEPQVTSYNRQFMGTVDYIWHSEGLQTIQVLDTIPKHILRRTSGFPTKKWGSDHIALACEFAFKG